MGGGYIVTFKLKILMVPSFSSPEPKAYKVSLLYGSRAVVGLCVHACVHTFKHKYLSQLQ